MKKRFAILILALLLSTVLLYIITGELPITGRINYFMKKSGVWNWQNIPGFTETVSVGDITAYAKEGNSAYYVKMGEINEFEGYTLETTEGKGKNLVYTFYPIEESDISHITVSGKSYLFYLARKVLLTSEPQSYYKEITLNGYKAYAYACFPAADETPDADTENEEHNSFIQEAGIFLEYDREHFINLCVYIEGDSTDRFVTEEDMVEFLIPFTEAFTVYNGE